MTGFGVFVSSPAAGAGGGAALHDNYVHSQATASDTWVVEHNLGMYPAITVIDVEGDVVDGGIQYDSDNVVTLRFSMPIAGHAYCS